MSTDRKAVFADFTREMELSNHQNVICGGLSQVLTSKGVDHVTWPRTIGGRNSAAPSTFRRSVSAVRLPLVDSFKDSHATNILSPSYPTGRVI